MEESIKEKDVVQTGRFGLGFKSIFHITDLPIILSGDYIGIIDPHQKYLPGRESAWNWHLNDHRDFLQSKEEQLRPLFKGIFGLDADILSDAEKYNHTAFRFPLRSHASHLSNNIYTAEKVLQLFQSLEMDEGQSLLFLKSVQCIEIYRQSNKADEPKLVYEMKVTESTAKQVSEKRQVFLEKVRQEKWRNKPVETILQMTVQVEHFQTEETSIESHDWLIYHSCHGDKAVIETADELKVLPWVGIALPISKPKDVEDGICRNAGHLYVTLPLPLDGTERTGLAFHAHAYFAMEQNRRHLRWPTLDQHEASSDPKIEWNQLLVTQCIPDAVVAFFRQVTCNEESEISITPDSLYKLLPNEDSVDAKWKPLVSCIYKELFTERCLYSPAKGKGWLKVEETFRCDDHLPDRVNKLLKEVLLTAGFPVTNTPPHIHAAIRKYSLKEQRTISALDVHNATKQITRNGNALERDDALMLLQYFLDHGKPQDLIDLPLLPVLSGEMLRFKEEAGSTPILLSSHEHPSSLLPGLEQRLVDTNLPDQLVSCLTKLSCTGVTQLKRLSFEHTINNLADVLPSTWAECDGVVHWSTDDEAHPDVTWLEQIWNYIHISSPSVKDWSKLDDLHLMPIDNCQTLCKFSEKKRIILGQSEESTLPKGVADFLSDVGCIVLRESPDFVYKHKDLLYHSVNLPTCQGIVDALMSLSLQSEEILIEKIKQFRSCRKSFFKEFISYMSDSGIMLLSPMGKRFLLGLPFFSTISGSGFQLSKSVSLNEVRFSGPNLELPVPFPVPVIDISDEKVKYMIEALDVCKYHQDNFPEILRDILLPAVKLKRYTREQEDNLLCYIMDQHPKVILENTGIAAKLAQVALVETELQETKSPKELYHPQAPFLPSLLGREFFPHKKYHTSDRLACLEKLGLRPMKQLTPKVFLQIAESLSLNPEGADDFMKLTKALTEQVPLVKWWEKLRDVAFLRVIQKKPEGYPKYLPWKGSTAELLTPKDICHIKFAKQAGCSVPFVDLDESTLDVLQAKVTPNLSDLVIQLKHVTEHYNSKEKSCYLAVLDEIYCGLAQFTKDEIQDSLDYHSVSSWIWYGKGFKCVGQMLLEDPEIKLSPYYYSVPSEMEMHRNLLKECGVPRTIHPEKVLKEIAEKHMEEERHSASSIAHDLQLAINLLGNLCTQGAKTALVPIETSDASMLRFKQALECTVWDDCSEFSDADNLFFVHPAVPKEVIDHFCIPTIKQRDLDGEEIGLIQDFGQNEPLTTRLKSVLQGYTDGLAVLKEMIQNADDAGATEVRLVYDMQKNKQWKKSLLDPGMADWQGPSIWIYNNAVFNDQDFENVRRLNGATKSNKIDQIGTFGLGFSSVYNLTDVPSVLSHDTLVIFDPHTTNLGKALWNKNKPGKKIPLAKTVRRRYSDQFAPWNGVCGCNLEADSEKVSFNGTLFRLPLRGHKQSIFSEISSNCYDERNVKRLLEMVYRNGNNLLLFTQNVLRVSVSFIPGEENGADLQMKDLFVIHKEPVQYLQEHGVQCVLSSPSQAEDLQAQKFINECSILKASVTSGNKAHRSRQLKSSMIIKSVMETSEEGSRYLGKTISESEPHTLWIVSQSIEDMPYVEGVTAKQQPVAGIAICLEEENGRYTLKPQNDSSGGPKGSYFSFLPLPVKSPLPFHINGTFILDQSRRHLVQKTDHDKHLAGGTWNKGLMKGAVCTAYMTALANIISLTSKDEDLSAILPVTIKDDLITSMSEMFWQRILEYPEILNIFLSPRGRVSMHDAYFLHPHFQQSCRDMEDLVSEVITSVFEGSSRTLVKLPINLEDTLRQVNSGLLDSKVITEEVFFTKFFLPNMPRLPLADEDRDVLLVKALRSKSSLVEKKLKCTACIPVSPDGKKLAKPNTLIHPEGEAAVLYSQKEGRFPAITCDGDSERKHVYDRLCILGMVRDDVSWDDICERSQNLRIIKPQSNVEQVQHFLDYLHWKLAKEKDKIPAHVQKALQVERFLPSDIKPKDWNLTWKGEEFRSYCGSELHYIKEPLIACTQLPILHRDISISLDVGKFLGIKSECTDHSVSIGTVKLHVQEIISNKENIQSPHVRESLQKVYQHLNEECKDDIKAEKVRQEFLTLSFLLVEERSTRMLVSAPVCAFKPKWTAFPYLNRVSQKYKHLYRVLGVENQFSLENFITSMVMIQEEKSDRILNQSTLHTVKRNLEELCKKLPEGCESIQELGIEMPIYIPDTKGVLKPAELLCYNKTQGLESSLDYPLVHACISNDIASLLGVKELGAHVLSERSHAIAYSSDGNLIDEIHSVLEAYPQHSQIVMELLQQADDAGATEIHFKLDPGKHNTETVFSKDWKTMQGPSLCVENDAKLKQESITELFLPGNVNQNDSTYKDGNGIQSVYHLTDTPTVLATLDDDDERELLCAYDPTCQHIEGTSPQEPAMMYKDVPLLRQFFPGVFECYKEKGFGYPGGTQFRFPLRTPESTTKCSTLCNSPSTCKDVDEMLESLTQEGYRALLFMTSLRKISVTRFNTKKSKFETVLITSAIPDGERKKVNERNVKEFRHHVEMENAHQKDHVECQFKKLSYVLRLNKTDGQEEVWTVVQHYGLENSADFTNHEFQEFQKSPIGGVAERHRQKEDCNFLFPSCQKIDLPVHVFGPFQGVHLAADKDSPKASLNERWNAYITEIIAQAYLDLIKARADWVRSGLKSSIFQSQTTIIRKYFEIFPRNDNQKDQGAISPNILPMVKRLYEMMTHETVLPEVLSCATDTTWVKPSEACFILGGRLSYTYSTKEGGTGKVDHTNVAKGANLCGLKIVECPEIVQKMIKEFCHCEPLYLSPNVLLMFLGDLNRSNHTRLSELVEVDKKSQWKPGWKVVEAMIKFCVAEKSFSEQLNHLPLLVTSDGDLRTFDKTKPVYRSLETMLLVPQSAKFLHPYFGEIFKDVESPVFKDLDIEGFCEEFERKYPELAKNEIMDLSCCRIHQREIEQIWKVIDKITRGDSTLLEIHAGHLSIWLTRIGGKSYLYPISKMDRVFQTRTPEGREHACARQLQRRILYTDDFPISVYQFSVADGKLASFEQPRSVLRALHHYRHAQENVADIFMDRSLLRYLTENIYHFRDHEDLLRDIPIFETLTGEYVPLTGNCVLIPEQVPMVDVDAWTTPGQDILFLIQKQDFRELYNQLGCELWTAQEVYIKYIFKHLELLSEEGHKEHMDWVFENLGNSPKVINAMRNLQCARNRTGEYCMPSDLYDPEVELFQQMQEDLPDTDLPITVLRKAGMICDATKEMLAAYARRPYQFDNSMYILNYIKERVDPDEQADYLEYLSDIPFVPQMDSGHSLICPENSEEQLVALRGSVVVAHSGLVWAVAPLIDDLQTKFKFDEATLHSAGVITEPSCELVARNIVKVCEHGKSDQSLSIEERAKLGGLIDACYNHISRKLVNGECTAYDKKMLQRILTDQFCVPVDQARSFVKPHETVIELKRSEEVKPYLNRLPDNLTYSNEVLLLLGLAEKPTVRAYQRVLNVIHDKFGLHAVDNAEDIQAAKLATRQVFKRIKKDVSLDLRNNLWLLSSRNHLCKSQNIIYSNNLGMQRRLSSKVKLLVDLNLKVNIESILEYFPQTHRPKLLTAVFNEEVKHDGDRPTALSVKLREHLMSQAMQQGFQRLAHHIMVSNPEQFTAPIQEQIAKVHQVMKTIKIASVKNLKTRLKSDTDMQGNWTEKMFFGELATSWFYLEQSLSAQSSKHVYMYRVLADMVNDLNNGLFERHKDVLMVILSSDAEDMSDMLDEMGVLPYTA